MNEAILRKMPIFQTKMSNLENFMFSEAKPVYLIGKTSLMGISGGVSLLQSYFYSV